MVADEPLIRWGWISDHLDEVGSRSLEHLRLTMFATVIGAAISVVLAVIATRRRWTAAPITWVSGALYAVPSLALFAVLIPLTGFSLATALIPLTSYTLSTLVPTTIAALNGVPADVRSAADAMGLTRGERLRQVDLPLALPVIISGLRIATVTTIGLVTVASTVGFGGYGAFIMDGLDRDFPTPLILGSALSVVLAALTDVVFVAAERRLTPWRRAPLKGQR